MVAALAEKIDRQMNKLSAEAKAEMKAYVATELLKKERAEGPVVLTKEQRSLATAPEPVRRQEPPQPQPEPRRMEPEPPRRGRSR